MKQRERVYIKLDWMFIYANYVYFIINNRELKGFFNLRFYRLYLRF